MPRSKLELGPDEKRLLQCDIQARQNEKHDLIEYNFSECSAKMTWAAVHFRRFVVRGASHPKSLCVIFEKATSQGHGGTGVTQIQNSTCVVVIFVSEGGLPIL